MADLRISQLNALNGADLATADLLVAVDDSASETKKLTVGDLISNGVTLIADDTIPGAKILFAAGGIATADLADSAVNTVKLADNGVTAAKLADESTVDLVTTLPASGAFTGQLALDTDDNFLYAWNGSVWVSLKAAGSINTVSGDTSGTINITTSTSGSTVTVSATIDDTSVANQFLAGPTGAGGTVAYRVIDSTDLPTSSTTAKGAVLVNGEGLRMDGDTIEVDNDVTDTTTHHVVTYSAKGLITGGRTLTSADLPLATSTDPGAIIPGDGLAVDVNGNLSIDNTVASGTYTKVTVTAEGVVSTGDTLGADDIPDHSAAKLTSGTIGSSLIASEAVTAAKLADESVTQFGGAVGSDNVTVFPAGDFKGQFFYDETTQDLYIYTGSAFVPITVLSGNLVNAGTYNANTNLMSSVTTAGSSAGFSVGSALPAPAGVNLNHYAVVDTSGTGSGAAPAVALAPPDMLLSQGVGTEYSLIDVSNAIAGQTASNISLIAAGDIVATNVQAGIQELDTEKLPKAGGTMTGDLTLNNVNVVFEGSSADDYETILTVTNPTADRTITLPNVSGTIITGGDIDTVTGTMIADLTITNTNINASAEIAVSKLANGTARQLLQTDAAGTGVEFTSNVDVPGTLDVTGAATLDSTASVAGLLSANGKISYTAGTAALPALYSGSDTNTGIYYPGADQFGISTAGSARFYIAADGKAGIGETTPDALLVIKGNSDAATTPSIRLKDGTDTREAWITNSAGDLSLNVGGDDNAAHGTLKMFDSGILDYAQGASSRLRMDASGNIGLGTTNPTGIIEAVAASPKVCIRDSQTSLSTASATLRLAESGAGNSVDNYWDLVADNTAGNFGFCIKEGADTRIAIKPGTGNIGLGTIAPSSKLDIFESSSSTTPAKMRFVNQGERAVTVGFDDHNASPVFSVSSGDQATKFVSIDSSGNVSVGMSPADTVRFAVAASSAYIFVGRDISGTTDKIQIEADGDVRNTNNSYGAISDQKLKENIVDANSQWEDIKALRIRNYNFKESTGHETYTQLGVVAQEVETVSPGLVSEMPDLDENGDDLGTTTKSVNYSVLYMKAVKALQEAMTKIETLETKVAALEAAN